MRRAVLLPFAATLVCAVGSPCVVAAENGAVPISVVDFAYIDTSGEAGDQASRHRIQLEAFMQTLRQDLERSGRFRLVSLDCGNEPCDPPSMETEDLVRAAKRGGARFLVVGSIHKMSTLVQTGRAQVVDVDAERLAFNRIISFRGDDANAWQRAEGFLVKEIVDQVPATPAP